MFSDTYKDIESHIKESVDSLIDNSDEYHNVHRRRYLRTIQVLLDQNPKGKLLELGTSKLLPQCLETLAPELEISVTDFDLEKPEKWQKKIGNKSYEAYSLDLEKLRSLVLSRS